MSPIVRSIPAVPAGRRWRRCCSASQPVVARAPGRSTRRCRRPAARSRRPQREVRSWSSAASSPSGNNSARVDAYSVEGGGWRRLPDLPVSVDHAAAASVNGRVYVAGGYGADRRPMRTVFELARRRLAPARGHARRPRRRGGRNHARPALCSRRPQRTAVARARCVRAELGSASWMRIPGPSRAGASRRDACGRPRLRGRRACRRASTRTRRRSRSTTARRGAGRASLRCRARGGTGAAALGGRIDSVGGERARGHHRERLRLRRADAPVDSARRPPHAPPRSRRGRCDGRIWAVAGGPVPGLTVSGAVESLKP